MSLDRCIRCGIGVAWIGLLVDLALVATKLLVGAETGSRALLADSLYSVIDVVSSVMVIASVTVSRKRVDAEHPYGHGKVEFLGIATVSVGIGAFAAFLLVRTVEELIKGEERPSLNPAAAMATVVAIVACTLIWRYAHCAGTRLSSPVIMTDAEHHKADAVSSVAVLGGVVLSWVGLGMLDPIVAVVENLHVLLLSLGMLRQGVDGLLDASVGPQRTARIAQVVQGVPGVLGVEEVRARNVGSSVWIDLRVRVAAKRRMAEVAGIRRLIRTAIDQHTQNVSNVMIEVLPAAAGAPGKLPILGQERIRDA